MVLGACEVESEAITAPLESNVTVLPFVTPVAGIVVTLPSVPNTAAVFVAGSTPITTPVGVGVAAGAGMGVAAGAGCDAASIGDAAVVSTGGPETVAVASIGDGLGPI